jgi:hypothetical protein
MVPKRLLRAEADGMIERRCSEKGLSVEALRAGSRNRAYPAIRRELAMKLVNELGMSHADVARRLGISRAGVSMLVRRCPVE